MDHSLDDFLNTESISICVQDPRLHKGGFWHTSVDYEICLRTNSMCFRKKSSSVRRQYSEFVWLRQCLAQNALMIELPKLPPWNPFFSLRNVEQVNRRMQGLQHFLEIVLQMPLLLSDSRLHLFLQSDLSIPKMERCALGKTRYTVAEAIHRAGRGSISGLECRTPQDFDCESTSSSGLGMSVDTSLRSSPIPFLESSGDAELFSCLLESPSTDTAH